MPQGRDLTAELYGGGQSSGRDLSAQLYGAPSGSTPVVTSTITDDSGNVIGSNPVTPGTADDSLIQHFGFDPAEIKNSPAYKGATERHGSGLSFLLTDPNANALRKLIMPVADSPIGDLGMGAFDVVRGVHQLGIHAMNKLGIVSDADAKYNDLVNRVIEEDYTQNIRHGQPNWFARIIGNIAVPGPGAAGKGASLGRTVLTGSASAAVQPVQVDGSTDYWAEKGKQAAAGAVVAPVASTVVKGIGKGIQKVANAVEGEIPKEAADLIAEGEKRGIGLTYGDITRSPGAQKMEVRMEDVPGMGMANFRKGQHDAARKAVQETAEDLKAAYQSKGAAAIKDVEVAANQGDEYARRVLDQIRNAGDDPDRIVQASIGLQNFRTRNSAEKLYDTVQEVVEKHGLSNAEVPTTGLNDAFNGAIKDAEAAVIPNKKLIGLLKDIKAGIEGKPQQSFKDYVSDNLQSALKDAGGDRAKAMDMLKEGWTAAENKVGETNTYSRLRRFRSDLGDIIREYRTNQNAIIGEKGVGHLERIRGGVEGDLQNFIDNSGVPEIQQAASDADRYYRQYRVPFKDAQLTYAASSTEPDQILQKFLMEGKGDRAQKLYNALDPQARSAVRYEMVRRAIDEATDKSKDVFSPQKFSGYFNKLEEPYQVFFRGARNDLEGLRNIMSHISRAGQFAENPPTGNRLVGMATSVGIPAAAGGAIYAAGVGGATAMLAPVGGVLGMSRFLLTTDRGKRLLLAAAHQKPGSNGMDRILGWIVKEIPRASGTATGQSAGEQQ
jgi:hypothetical protein